MKLFEISVHVSRTAVILAESEADALQHVSTWEKAWESHSDLIGVSEPDISAVRDLTVPPSEWEDEAHDATNKARASISEEGPQ